MLISAAPPTTKVLAKFLRVSPFLPMFFPPTRPDLSPAKQAERNPANDLQNEASLPGGRWSSC